MKITLNDLLNAKGVSEPLQGAVKALIDRLEAAESDGLEQARLNGIGAEKELALMAKLEAAEKERDELRIELKETRYGVAVAHDTIKAMRAKIEAMEKQEPVAEIGQQYSLLFVGSGSMTEIAKRHGITIGSKLYALPGAKGE